MICTTYFLTFFSELIPPTGKIILFLSFTTSIMLAYQNQDIKILENSFLAIPIEMAENTLCFQFKLLSLPRPPFLVGYGTDGTRCTNQT